MITDEITKERLKQVLEGMPNVTEVIVDGIWRFMATVISPSFRDRDEAERQADVWSYVREHLSADEDQLYEKIEFIFTNTPEEQRAQQEQAAPA